MYINKLKLKAFGKFHNKELELRPGINLIYGQNEAGKTTIKEFILGMLYGIEKSRGLAARLDNYEIRKPLSGGGYAGSCTLFKSGKEYLVERNFERSDKKLSLFSTATGREINTGENGLVDVLFHVEKNKYLDTLCIGQQGADTSKDLASGINNYMINMSSAQTTDVDYASAINYLKQEKKKYNTKSLDEQLNKMAEDIHICKNADIALVNVKYRLDKLDEEYNKKAKELESDEDFELDELENETNKIISNNIVSIVAVAIVAIILIMILIAIAPLSEVIKIILVVVAVILVIVTLAVCFVVRARLRERQIERSIMVKKVKSEEKNSAVSFAKEYAFKIAELKSEEMKILEQKSELEDRLREYEDISKKRELCLIEIQAIEEAMSTIKILSENIYDDFGKSFNANVSHIVSHMTNGRYSEVLLDEQLHISVRKGDTFIGIEFLSKGTMEQIYFAVRLAAAKLLGTDCMPIIVDDIFGAYDELRLKRTLEYLETVDTQQVILFTSDTHMGEMLDHLNKDYNYIEL